MQSATKQQDRDMVHSLVKRIVPKDADGKFQYLEDPKFELVSRYAESVVAKKLAKEQALKLKQALEEMSPLSGAEGYAGALFEAYAIRRIQAGGDFAARSLDAGASKTICIPL
jgi:5'-deoxynucleotidase YfbR-like HD superfamily hydrolase